jgi:hypothetical protein
VDEFNEIGGSLLTRECLLSLGAKRYQKQI